MATIKKPNLAKKQIPRTSALKFKHGSADIFSFFEPTRIAYPRRGVPRPSVASAWKLVGDDFRLALEKVDTLISKGYVKRIR